MNYARRQQYRRLSRAASSASGAAAVAMLGLWLASTGATSIAGVLLLLAIVLGLRARHLLVLAGRSRVGARSEDEVQRALGRLEGEGWRLRHSLWWRGRGDIDSVAIAPTGFAFAIETKTRTFDANHVAGVREMALWIHRRRRRWCRSGALPVLCVVRASGLEYVDGDVLIVSLDRLVPALRVAAGLAKRPAFLAGTPVIRSERDLVATPAPSAHQVPETTIRRTLSGLSLRRREGRRQALPLQPLRASGIARGTIA